MNYLEKIMEILQRATVEELFMVLRFAENVVESVEHIEKGGQSRPPLQ